MGRGLRAWLLPLLLCLASLAGAIGLTMQPPAKGAVALIFPPWWGRTQAAVAAAAAGRLIRFGGFPFVVIIMPDRSGPDGRWPSTAAWLALDPARLGSCGTPSS